jgi:hypothetical protein
MSAQEGPVTEPHADPPYPVILSLAKTGYLFLDFLLGWAFRVRPWVRRGGWVVLERGWWDIAVDPRRYRLRAPARTAWLLGRFLPAPDLTVVLEAPDTVLLSRKRELPAEELGRQRDAWRNGLPGGARPVYLDASLPALELAERVGRELRTRSKLGMS